MQRRSLGLVCIALIIVFSGCQPAGTSPSTSSEGQSGTAPTGVVPAATGVPSAEPITQTDAQSEGIQSEPEFIEALTAREAWEIADAEAGSRYPDYALYEVSGCHDAASYGQYQRDSHLVEGACVQWMFYYVRPVDPDSLKGYHALYLRVGPNGVLEAIEEARPEQVRKKPRGDLADWKVDSSQAIAIAEDAGGRAYRQANPEWDTARFESDRNAMMIATLGLTPYWDSDSGKDYSGTADVVWVVTYPPLHALLYVIDATTGEVLLEREG